jgi:hypothetical protein
MEWGKMRQIAQGKWKNKMFAGKLTIFEKAWVNCWNWNGEQIACCWTAGWKWATFIHKGIGKYSDNTGILFCVYSAHHFLSS